jgi:hypothetical protein
LDDLLRHRYTQFAASCLSDHKIEKQCGRQTQSMGYHQGEKVISDEHSVICHMQGQGECFSLTLAQVVILQIRKLLAHICRVRKMYLAFMD